MPNPYAAKSKVNTKPVQTEEEIAEEVPKGTVSEILAWVGDDKDRAQRALDAENAGAKRRTLVSALEDKLEK